jgi:hypothetical protein
MDIRQSLLAQIFIRLYARNLERSNRADPDEAYSDALAQTGAFVGLFAISTVWFTTAFFWHAHYSTLSHDPRYFVASFAFSALVVYPMIKRCKQYELTPQIVDPYRSPKDVWLTRILFMVTPVLWICLWGFALHELRPFLQ